MYIKFWKNRSSSFGDKISTAWKKWFWEKQAWNFFLWKIVKKLYLQLISDAGTIQNPFCFDFLKSILLIDSSKLIKWDDTLIYCNGSAFGVATYQGIQGKKCVRDVREMRVTIRENKNRSEDAVAARRQLRKKRNWI